MPPKTSRALGACLGRTWAVQGTVVLPELTGTVQEPYDGARF